MDNVYLPHRHLEWILVLVTRQKTTSWTYSWAIHPSNNDKTLQPVRIYSRYIPADSYEYEYQASTNNVLDSPKFNTIEKVPNYALGIQKKRFRSNSLKKLHQQISAHDQQESHQHHILVVLWGHQPSNQSITNCIMYILPSQTNPYINFERKGSRGACIMRPETTNRPSPRGSKHRHSSANDPSPFDTWGGRYTTPGYACIPTRQNYSASACPHTTVVGEVCQVNTPTCYSYKCYHIYNSNTELYHAPHIRTKLPHTHTPVSCAFLGLQKWAKCNTSTVRVQQPCTAQPSTTTIRENQNTITIQLRVQLFGLCFLTVTTARLLKRKVAYERTSPWTTSYSTYNPPCGNNQKQYSRFTQQFFRFVRTIKYTYDTVKALTPSSFAFYIGIEGSSHFLQFFPSAKGSYHIYYL